VTGMIVVRISRLEIGDGGIGNGDRGILNRNGRATGLVVEYWQKSESDRELE
jgi:hypothetical protein